MHPCLAGSPGGPAVPAAGPRASAPQEQRQQQSPLPAGEEDTEGGEDLLEKCSGPSPVPESGQLPSGSHSHCRVGGETLPCLHLTFPPSQSAQSLSLIQPSSSASLCPPPWSLLSTSGSLSLSLLSPALSLAEATTPSPPYLVSHPPTLCLPTFPVS